MLSQVFYDVMIGLLTAAIATPTTYVTRRFWALQLSKLSRRRGIKGTWETSFHKKDTKTGAIVKCGEIAILNQFGSKVWGTITYGSRVYDVEGIFQHNVLVATYAYKSGSVIDRGAFTLTLDHSGKRMAGKFAWTDETSGVYADDYIWEKTDEA